MYTYIIISTVICMLIIAFYNTFIVKHNRKEQQKTAEQPTHFDLLDDNGDPISSSDDRSRASAPHPIHEPSVQRLQYFCIKDKGYHVSVWPKDIDEYLGESVATLEAETTNPYDPNAIKIVTHDGHHVGYVPKDMTAEMRNVANLPCPCFFYIGSKNGTYYSDCYVIRKS